MTRRRSRFALPAAVFAGTGLLLTTVPVAGAAPQQSGDQLINQVNDALKNSDEGAPIELPANGTYNFDIEQAANDGDAIVQFLRDASDKLSKLFAVNSQNGDIFADLDKVINDAINRLSSGNGSSDPGSSKNNAVSNNQDQQSNANQQNEANAANGDNSNFAPEDKPDFIKQNDNGTLTADTNGVKPGKYTLTGQIDDGSGDPRDVSITFEVSDSNQNNNGNGQQPSNGSNNNDQGSNSTAPSSSSKPSGTDQNGSANNNSDETASQEPSDQQQSGPISYPNADVSVGDSVEVQPEGDTDDFVFVNATADQDWVKVDRETGVVTLSPDDGLSAGDKTVTVGYVTKDKMQSVLEGNDSDIQVSKFTAHVSQGDDQQADSVSNGNGTPSNSGDSETTSDSSSKGASDDKTGSSSSNGSNSTNAQNRSVNRPSASQQPSSSATPSSSSQAPSPQQQDPRYQNEQAMPVTGVNGQSWVMAGIGAIGLIAVGGVMLFASLRRRNS